MGLTAARGDIDERMIAGIRVRFRYDRGRRVVAVEPNDCDLTRAPLLSVMRLWCIVGRWVESLPTTHPGWSVAGIELDDLMYEEP